MAELAGLILSGVGLLALANTVTDCLDQVDRARNLGKDYDHYALQLDLARLAYQRWLQSVRIVEPGTETLTHSNLPKASEQETRLVKQLLGNIENAFKDARGKEERYDRGLKDSSGSGGSTSSQLTDEPELVLLGDKVRETQRRRQTSVKLLDKVRWVVRDSKVMQTLSERVSQNVKSLVELFPAATQTTQEQMAAADIAEIVPSGNKQTLSLLQAVATDEPMKHMAAEAIKRSHTYENAKLSGSARALYGDQVAQGAQVTGYGHTYTDVSATDNAKAIYGNQYGMKNFLDD